MPKEKDKGDPDTDKTNLSYNYKHKNYSFDLIKFFSKNKLCMREIFMPKSTQIIHLKKENRKNFNINIIIIVNYGCFSGKKIIRGIS